MAKNESGSIGDGPSNLQRYAAANYEDGIFSEDSKFFFLYFHFIQKATTKELYFLTAAASATDVRMEMPRSNRKVEL